MFQPRFVRGHVTVVVPGLWQGNVSLARHLCEYDRSVRKCPLTLTRRVSFVGVDRCFLRSRAEIFRRAQRWWWIDCRFATSVSTPRPNYSIRHVFLHVVNVSFLPGSLFRLGARYCWLSIYFHAPVVIFSEGHSYMVRPSSMC